MGRDGFVIYSSALVQIKYYNYLNILENFVTTYSKNTPFEGAFRRPNLTLTSNSFVHDYWVFISHLMPAYISDIGLTLIGQKPR